MSFKQQVHGTNNYGSHERWREAVASLLLLDSRLVNSNCMPYVFPDLLRRNRWRESERRRTAAAALVREGAQERSQSFRSLQPPIRVRSSPFPLQSGCSAGIQFTGERERERKGGRKECSLKQKDQVDLLPLPGSWCSVGCGGSSRSSSDASSFCRSVASASTCECIVK